MTDAQLATIIVTAGAGITGLGGLLKWCFGQ